MSLKPQTYGTDADRTTDSTFLQGLLRYPMPSDGNARILLLFQQASYLRDNPTNFGGAYVRRQNQQLGAEAGIKSGTRAEEAMYEKRSATPISPQRPQTPAAAALLDQGRTLAEGLYGRAEALGINKALFSTIGELRVSQARTFCRSASALTSPCPSMFIEKCPSLSDYKRSTSIGNAFSCRLERAASAIIRRGDETPQSSECSHGRCSSCQLTALTSVSDRSWTYHLNQYSCIAISYRSC